MAAAGIAGSVVAVLDDVSSCLAGAFAHVFLVQPLRPRALAVLHNVTVFFLPSLFSLSLFIFFQMCQVRVAGKFASADAVLDVLNAGAEAVVLPAQTAKDLLAQLPPSRVYMTLTGADVAAAADLVKLCAGFMLAGDLEAAQALRKRVPESHEVRLGAEEREKEKICTFTQPEILIRVASAWSSHPMRRRRWYVLWTPLASSLCSTRPAH